MNVYPIFLNNLAGRRCVVVGGDHEAERKAGGLLECDAAVVVISPDLNEPLRQWADAGQIAWIPRGYQRGDLHEAFLAIVSEADPATAEAIWEEAQTEKVLLNTMDDVPHCTFVAGSVVRRGPLVVSISTSGCAPVLAVRLRQHLEQTLGPEYEAFLALSAALRAPLAARFPDFSERRRRWYALIDSDILDLLRAGDLDTAHQRIEEIMGVELPISAFPSPDARNSLSGVHPVAG